MKNQENQNQKKDKSQNPIIAIAENQQAAYGSKLDVRTQDYDIEKEPGYENHIHPNAGAATNKVVAAGSGEKLPDLSKLRTQETEGGENQLKESENNTQAGADSESQHHENGYGDNQQQKNVNENVEAANNDPLKNGHVVSNQDEKEDLREDIANDGTTTEGR